MLDSSTLIRVLRRRGDDAVTRRLSGLSAGVAAICTVVRHELVFGALRERNPAEAVPHLLGFLARFPCLGLDEASADAAARIRGDLAARGTPIGPHDLLIAAIAATHGLVVVTSNVGEFGRVAGLGVETWDGP